MASHCAEYPMNPRHDRSHPLFRLSTGEGSSVQADAMKHAFVDETRASRWVSEQPGAQPLAITRLNSGHIVVDAEGEWAVSHCGCVSGSCALIQ